jgi:hypothetical protein
VDEIKTGLCVLITNARIEHWTGSELYVRDVAVELIKRGNKPVVYSPRIGALAADLGRRSIPVVKDLNTITVKPDLIHGQHHLETMTALAHYPGTPAVFFCHGWQPWEETPPYHPRILQYVTVSDALRDRLIYEFGIPAEKVTTILNSVDMERFQPRQPLPDLPRHALVFNSQVCEANILGIIREACSRSGIILDVMGYRSGNPSLQPEEQLGSYDLIFATSRAALEGLATGAAVICCGVDGMAGMVTSQNLEWMRSNNFGIRVLMRPLTSDLLATEIKHYDPLDARKVTEQVRAEAGLGEMVDQILNVYNRIIDRFPAEYQPDLEAESLAYSTYLKGLSDKISQSGADIRTAQERARDLQTEIDEVKNDLKLIKGTFTWKLYQRLARISLLRKVYFTLVKPIWMRRKSSGKQ